ncbi:ABC transporter permease [Listeria monocytogenes]|uniref:ABC transporter permease n=2 Tax=Listeria monocytogenes TaxID=1639 RepID=A0A3T1NEU8_LISMN|nr:ABC transporter permease [Listeria monocytogenes]EAG6271169.1 ABC transporter permease [Listeria monocytogenes CFSAN003726]EAG6273946.1 ABC transporter permease [Listeria monocytogenes CFSAN003808]EAG6280649.1 ABC transporter permease [Listeria monocytogenes CFSAN003809]EAG6359290.1 ABC transporter permease [Listeria monocytogenes CFSAN003729]EAG6368199.1 ABC transporter permease [Listeria monocytogenes CFSAN003728]EAH4396625.1 ABC transporter permease [Listeria monocytogenes serotype 3a]
MSKFWVITKQVYKRRVKTKSFLISLLFPVLIAGLIAGIPKMVDYFDSSSDITKIAVLSEDPVFAKSLAADKNHFKINSDIKDKKSAQSALKDGKIDGFVTITQKDETVSAVYTTQETAGQDVITRLTEDLTATKIAEKAAAYKITNEQLQSITSPVSVTNDLESNNQLTNHEKDVMSAAVLILTLVIFIFVMSYANIVASEIATEKGTRIMEVILSSVSATTHLFAKLTAIIFMLLTQIGFYIICGAIVLIAGRNTEMVQNVLDQIAVFPAYYLVLNLLFVILGLLLYILLAAMIGSMVPNVETVAQFIYPMTILAIIGYWGSIAAANAPDNMLVIIGSYIPTFSPMMMLARMDLLSVSTIGIFSSLAILLVSVVGAFFLTVRLYQGNVLLYSNDGLWKTWKTSLSYAKRK